MLRWVALFAFGASAAAAQSGRSYSAGHPWWSAGDGGVLPWQEAYDNPDGQLSIYNKGGAVHTEGNAFFERIGSNGRACVTCHQPSDGMSLAAVSIRARWNETGGKDAVFAAVDGSNCPDLPQALESSHSLLLHRGLFRIFLPLPKDADFRIGVVRDPTGCNKNASVISVYRRPRVVANFREVMAGPDEGLFMADGREPSLRSQAVTAAIVHEQAGAPPSAEQLRQILAFEAQVYVAQSADIRGGRLDEKGGPAVLGPENLADGSAAGSAHVFDIWRKPGGSGLQYDFRASVARGSDVFFSRTFRVGDQTSTCATCHNSSTAAWMDIGMNRQNIPDLPLFRITCNVTKRVMYTQDPGRALISGKCSDVGSVAAQQLRGLAARAPYFSNGSARTLDEVVDFHDRRFHIGLTTREKQDLVNFLKVL